MMSYSTPHGDKLPEDDRLRVGAAINSYEAWIAEIKESRVLVSTLSSH